MPISAATSFSHPRVGQIRLSRVSRAKEVLMRSVLLVSPNSAT